MASLVKVTGKPDKKTGERETTWRIDYEFADENKRRHIRLGKMSEGQARSIKKKVQFLIVGKDTGTRDPDALQWATKLDAYLYGKLAKHGLVAPRVKVEVLTLQQHCDAYIARRTDVAQSTMRGLKECRQHLVNFFGEDRRLDSFAPAEAADFRRYLRGKLGENTTRRMCGRAKQFFRDAMDRRLISESPFAKMKKLSVDANHSRDYFVTREEAKAVEQACPDNQWKLLFALCRFGGLRCPSEPLVIRWADVDWKRDTIHINSPKTGTRIIPIFPEVRPYLEMAWDETPEGGSEFVITRYRDTNANLRTQLNRIIKRAGLKPWPKLFQNLRATRETELLDEFNIKVVCEWIGNTQPVAMKHYIQMTSKDWEKATGRPAKPKQLADQTGEQAQHTAQQNGAQDVGRDQKGREPECEKPGDLENHRVPLVPSVLPVGLEPTTY